ncbi:MAG: hypothetical protein DRJ51_01100, partial [Thermoprotei archaeon]
MPKTSVYILVGLIIGILIGAGLGYALAPKGVPAEEYNKVKSELEAVKGELNKIKPDYEALLKLAGKL